MNMENIEVLIDQMGMILEVLRREDDEIQGHILNEELFEAGQKWRDREGSVEALELLLSEIREHL